MQNELSRLMKELDREAEAARREALEQFPAHYLVKMMAVADDLGEVGLADELAAAHERAYDMAAVHRP